jgi:DNA-binding NarL/FixJ family response regulator
MTGQIKLAPRQKEVLSLVARGKQKKEISKLLGIGQGTIKAHLLAAQRNTGTRNTVHAVYLASQAGLI